MGECWKGTDLIRFNKDIFTRENNAGIWGVSGC